MKKLFILFVFLTSSLAFASGVTQIFTPDYPMPAEQTGVWNIQDITGTVSLPTGAATEAKQDTGNASLSSIDTKVSTAAKQDTAQVTLDSIDGKVSTAAKQDTGNASLSSIDGKVATEATLSAINSKLSASSATITAVASSATSVELLAANASRKGFKLFNDSNKDAYVAFAATASTAAYTLKMAPQSFYESDTVQYTGVISAIWSAVNGNMLVTSY